jgi:hypothetical protein
VTETNDEWRWTDGQADGVMVMQVDSEHDRQKGDNVKVPGVEVGLEAIRRCIWRLVIMARPTG